MILRWSAIVSTFIYCITAQSFLESDLICPSDFAAESLQSDLLADEVRTLQERLPRNVEVSKYELEIWPYFPWENIKVDSEKRFTFDGTVTIHFKAIKTTSDLFLFSKNITVDSAFLKDDKDKYIALSLFQHDPLTTRIQLSPVRRFVAGKSYSLTITYTGLIFEKGAGLFYSPYTTKSQKKKYLVATFLESLNARSVFPSFDDPFFKATFKLTLIAPQNAVVYGNTRYAKPRPHTADYDRYEFDETPVMSTYLFAFAIGDFITESKKSKSGITVTASAIAEQANNRAYLLDAVQHGVDCLNSMEKLSGIKYPLPKIDHIETLYMGTSAAMENWGLLVYRRYLAHPTMVIPSSMKYIQAKIICHETVHQWFGNLVTADHWGQEFLHESFAAYFEKRAAEEFTPEKESFGTAKIEYRNAGLTALKNTHRHISGNHADFGDLAYAAGSSVLWMIESTIGSKDFLKSLNYYLKKYEYKNAVDANLFEAFELNTPKVCGDLGIEEIMTDFFKQYNHPKVVVGVVNNKYMIRQFPGNFSQEEGETLWNIPLKVWDVEAKKVHHIVLLKDGEICVKDGPKEFDVSKVYLFNYGGSTAARVRYISSMWERILKLDFTQIDYLTQLGLLTDLIEEENEGRTLVSKKRISFQLLNRLIPQTKGKTNFLVSYLATTLYERYERYFLSGNEKDLFERVYANLAPVAVESDWTAEDWTRGRRNKQFLPVAVRKNLGNARAKGLELFTKFRADCAKLQDLETCNTIVPDSRDGAYCAAALDSVVSNVNFLRNYWAKLLETVDTYFYMEYEVDAVENGLSCLVQETDVRQVFDTAILKNRKIFGKFGNKAGGSTHIHDYLRNNFAKFNLKLDLFEDALKGMIWSWTTKDDEDKYKALSASIGNRLSEAHRKILANVEVQLKKNVESSESERLSLTKWIFDTQLPLGKPNWPAKLPEVNVRDIRYDLTFRPYFPVEGYEVDKSKNGTFEGTVEISFAATDRFSRMWLNTHRHIIRSLKVERTQPVQEVIEATFSRNYEDAILTIDLESTVMSEDKVTVTIEYVGFFVNPGEGVFTFDYFNTKTNKLSYYMATAFTHGPLARSLVPCFDEPDHKGVWSITIIHPSTLVALSNGPIVASDDYGVGHTKTIFGDTRIMPSYLLAITVGEYAAVSKRSASGIPVKVWAPPGFEVYGLTALEAASDTIDFLSKYTGVKFNEFANKLDIVCVHPYWGAIENWGLIMSQPSATLYNPAVNTDLQRQSVYGVIAHETVHHWFGDLVTPKDWRFSFVSEAFATYFEASSYGEPTKFGRFIRFHDSERALRYDAENKVPVVPDVILPTLYPFTPIVYAKPASVIHSLRQVIGDATFQKAIREYFATNAFGNANDEDLWSSFQTAVDADKTEGWSGKLDVEKAMDPYTRQVSFPVLGVEARPNMYVQVRQAPFHDKLPTSKYGNHWNVPLFTNATKSPLWTIGNSAVSYSAVGANILNVDRKAYARVFYDAQTWQAVSELFAEDPLPISDITRASVITDTYALIDRGNAKWSQLLGLLRYAKKERAEIPWYYINEIFQDLLDRLRTHPTEFAKLSKFITDLVDDRGVIYKSQRVNLQIFVYFDQLEARLQLPAFHAKAKPFFDEIVQNCLHSPKSLDSCIEVLPEFRGPVLCAGIHQTPAAHPLLFDAVVELAQREADDPFLLRRIEPLLEAVGCLNDEAQSFEYLDSLLESDFDNVASLLLFKMTRLDPTGLLIGKYIENNAKDVAASDHFKALVNFAFAKWGTDDLLQKFKKLPWNGLSTEQQQFLNQIENLIKKNIEWEKHHLDDISQFLSKV